MSLHHAAQHLASQGRGPDTMLVHMAPNEVNALNQFAKSHGTHLTVNPKTGLPEAGLLSMLIGGATAIFAPELLPFIAGGVGLASAVSSGSLGQGIMQGLSAWGGGNLAGSIQNLAQTGAENIGNLASTTAQKTAESLPVGATSEVGMFNQFPNAVSGGAGADIGLGNIPMSGGEVGMANSFPATMGGSGPSGFASPFSGFDAGQGFNKFASGAEQLVSHPIDSVKQIWEMPGGKASLIGAGMTAAPYLLSAFQPDPYKAPEQQKNPMGFKTLSKDFKGTFPEQPKPAYQAQYRDYVTNPYIPSTTLAAGGGLQTVNFANRGLVNYGLSMLNQEQKQAPITATDPGAVYSPAYNSIGISPYEKNTELTSSDKMAESLLKQVKSLGKIASKASVMMPDPADTSKASIANDTQTTSAKEGGLMQYALGGLSVGHLGGYSDGGRLLKGPGDGVSDSIPASIGHKQPARLAEGEFVIPARIVSELGNGSTDAGAKRLYAMMDRIKAKRAKTKNIAADSKTYNLLPA